MSNQKLLLFFLVVFIVPPGCKKAKHDEQKPFAITENYIAGTISPKSNSYQSVYLISLLSGNRAVFISSGNNLYGEYTLTNDSLIVTISDPANYRIAKFSINEDHELTSAYYKALTMEYNATGSLLPISKENLLAGKTFKGEEFKMGPSSFRKDLVYKFNQQGTSYGSGVDIPAIDVNANSFELINSSAFKYKNGNTTEMGFVNGTALTVFRSGGLFYYGTYNQQ